MLMSSGTRTGQSRTCISGDRVTEATAKVASSAKALLVHQHLHRPGRHRIGQRPDDSPESALGGAQPGSLSRNGSTAASFSAIPQTSVAFPSRTWKTWVYFHSALDPSW